MDPFSIPDYTNWNGLGVFDMSMAQWKACCSVTLRCGLRLGVSNCTHGADLHVISDSTGYRKQTTLILKF